MAEKIRINQYGKEKAIDWIELHKHSHNKIGRNDYCPCGSGKKYKYCCLRDVEKINRVINNYRKKLDKN